MTEPVEMDARVIRIVRGVWRRTVERDEIEWERRATRSGDDIFDFSLADMTISIGRDAFGSIYLQLIDETGGVIETFLASTPGAPDGFSSALDQIYETARRKALRVDERLDLLDDQLGED
jgi:hypothetical protein